MNRFRRERKDVLLRIKISQSEHLHLNQLVKQSYMTTSDYVRQRLFEENLHELYRRENHKLSNSNNIEMMKLIVHIFTIIKEIGRSTLPEKEYKKSIDLAKDILKELQPDE